MKLKLLMGLCVLLGATLAHGAMPAGYYDEPVGLPYAETILQEKTEDGWKWTEFRYTSIVYHGEPMRIHAIYAVPLAAGTEAKVPLIVMTHGKFGQIMKIDERQPESSPNRWADPRYWSAVKDLAKAGYAVMYFEWNPDPAIKAGPLPSGAVEPQYSTFGSLDFSKDWYQSGDDWRDGMFYQAMMAGRRAISWAAARPEVDATRIGATGASFGGIFSSLLAAIDLRIKAVAPTVYATGFGAEERSYNSLSPKKFTAEQTTDWKSRFDSEVLLAKRAVPLPLLYSVGTNDAAFTILKATRHYRALPEPKQILIAPNQGHNFWNFAQTVRFFDRELRHTGTRPVIADVKITGTAADGWQLSVETDAPTAEFFYALEPVPDMTVRADQRVQPEKWKWVQLKGASAMLKLSEEERSKTVTVHVFAQAKDPSGTEACSPLVAVGVTEIK